MRSAHCPPLKNKRRGRHAIFSRFRHGCARHGVTGFQDLPPHGTRSFGNKEFKCTGKTNMSKQNTCIQWKLSDNGQNHDKV